MSEVDVGGRSDGVGSRKKVSRPALPISPTTNNTLHWKQYTYTASEPGDRGNLTCLKCTKILLLALYHNHAIIFVFRILFLLNVNYDLSESVKFNFKNENVFVLRSYARVWLPVLVFNYRNVKCFCSSISNVIKEK